MGRVVDGIWIPDWLWNNEPDRVIEILGRVPEGMPPPRALGAKDWKVKQAKDDTFDEEEL